MVFRNFCLLFFCICILPVFCFSQCTEKERYMSFQNSVIVFYNDGTYNYHYSSGGDLSIAPPIDAYNKGRYTKQRNKTYYLYSDTARDPLKPVLLDGEESQMQDPLFHLIILDSVKHLSEPKYLLNPRYDYQDYFYLVKIVYSHDSLDSVHLRQRWELQLQNLSLSSLEAARQDSILIQKFKLEDEQRGLLVVNGSYFQQFICYGQQLDFEPVLELPIHSIEIEILPLHPNRSFDGYAEGFAHCTYPIQYRESNRVALYISPDAYQKIHNPFYSQSIAEIVNKNTIVFDRQVFFKLPPEKKYIKHRRKNHSYGSFYGFAKLMKFNKRHKIHNPYYN